jgi:hypothetical protein
VVASTLIGDSGSIATTSYMAERLDLPSQPAEPASSLRSVLTELIQE